METLVSMWCGCKPYKIEKGWKKRKEKKMLTCCFSSCLWRSFLRESLNNDLFSLGATGLSLHCVKLSFAFSLSPLSSWVFTGSVEVSLFASLIDLNEGGSSLLCGTNVSWEMQNNQQGLMNHWLTNITTNHLVSYHRDKTVMFFLPFGLLP